MNSIFETQEFKNVLVGSQESIEKIDTEKQEKELQKTLTKVRDIENFSLFERAKFAKEATKILDDLQKKPVEYKKRFFDPEIKPIQDELKKVIEISQISNN